LALGFFAVVQSKVIDAFASAAKIIVPTLANFPASMAFNTSEGLS